MKDILVIREERIKFLISIGFTADIDKGIIYRPNGKVHNSKGNQGYKEIKRIYNDKLIGVKYHQFIYYLAHNKVIDIIDHVDRDKTNNCISNLRDGSNGENSKNRLDRGYCHRKDNNKYRARINHEGVKINLGQFDTAEEARQAYLNAKIKYSHI